MDNNDNDPNNIITNSIPFNFNWKKRKQRTINGLKRRIKKVEPKYGNRHEVEYDQKQKELDDNYYNELEERVRRTKPIYTQNYMTSFQDKQVKLEILNDKLSREIEELKNINKYYSTTLNECTIRNNILKSNYNVFRNILHTLSFDNLYNNIKGEYNYPIIELLLLIHRRSESKLSLIPKNLIKLIFCFVHFLEIEEFIDLSIIITD